MREIEELFRKSGDSYNKVPKLIYRFQKKGGVVISGIYHTTQEGKEKKFKEKTGAVILSCL